MGKWTTTPPILKSPDGEPFDIDNGHDFLRLFDRLNALQAVAEAAKKLEAMAFKEPRQGHCSHQQHRVVQDDDFLNLRTALAELKASHV